MVKEISRVEVKKHRDHKNIWIIIHNDVYDVTSFLEEHPGGADSLLEVAGQDGTQGFEDVGHSEDARLLLKKYKIGTLPASEVQKKDYCRSQSPKISERKSRSPNRMDKSTQKVLLPRTSRSQSPKKSDGKITCLKPERRIQRIVVPRTKSQRNHSCSSSQTSPLPPPPRSNLKWAIVALATATLLGIALKKYLH